MAKTAPKKQAVKVNARSRAAKRATSPSIDVDRSIKDAPRALGTDPVLSANNNAGVTKKKKSKQMTRAQRARQGKGFARAEAVMDQMAQKVDGAQSRLKKRHQRKALWDDVNESAIDEQRKASKGPGRVAASEETRDEGHEQLQAADDIDMGSIGNDNASHAKPVALLPGASEQSSLVNAHPVEESDLIT